MSKVENVIRIKPHFYIHVLDNNTNVCKLLVGPMTFTRQDHITVVAGPLPMVMVPPRHYCVIKNPVIRTKDGQPDFHPSGQVRVKFGDTEVRFNQDPFPLYPEEILFQKPVALHVVAANQALRLKVIRDYEFKNAEGKIEVRVAGNEWLFAGPGTYIPRIEETVSEKINAVIIKQNEALKLRARAECLDRLGRPRMNGEEWLIRQAGAYLPGADEEIVGTVKAYVLTPSKALHLQATHTFSDVFGVRRKAGEEWLVTLDDCDTYITDVYEKVVGMVAITVLNNRQFAVILDPWSDDNKQQFLGKRILRKGECTFFLKPGETLEHGRIQDVFVLAEEQALLLTAREEFTCDKVTRKPGDRWMIYGPSDYIPPVECEVCELRNAIPLDENEGIYVRDMANGSVRAVIGESYMLKPNEQLWAKELPPEVEELLVTDASRDQAERHGSARKARDKTRVVSYRVPHNCTVQVYDYKTKTSRVVFGPEMVMLSPDEHFTVNDLSGGIPKQSGQIRSIALFLGPDFMTDVIVVETADHARLSLKLSYNWYFNVNAESKPDEAAKIFSTPDFVADLCKAIGARVRGAVAQTSFDILHKRSADIIQSAVFGKSTSGEINQNLFFPNNNLVVTNIDIQSVDPVDQRTRDSLQQSVQLAIEITTNSQEASAKHEAERLAQEAKGRLERQKLEDEAANEQSRKSLLELQALSLEIETKGAAVSAAKARTAAVLISAQTELESAKLEAQSAKIASESELAEMIAKQAQEIQHENALADLEIQQAKDLANVEAEKFSQIVDAIGSDTIKKMAQAGPEMQQQLLQGLGLKSLMITDGNSPINLFNTASGLIGKPE